MIQSLPPPDGLLVTIVLATLTIGLPIVLVLSIRFLLDRTLNLGRSKELEKLIWQLHRIASAMEHQMNLPSFAGQPVTQNSNDATTLLQQPATQLPTATQSVAASTAAAASATPATQPVREEQPETPLASTQPASVSQTAPREPSAQGERQGGVNSMFGL
jgi:hypothetical protein